MEKEKMIYNFDQYLDEVYGKPGTPRREAFRKDVTAYRNMIEPKQLRANWSEAFAKYAKEGEDKMLLPDCVDNDGEIEL